MRFNAWKGSLSHRVRDESTSPKRRGIEMRCPKNQTTSGERRRLREGFVDGPVAHRHPRSPSYLKRQSVFPISSCSTLNTLRDTTQTPPPKLPDNRSQTDT